MGNRNKTSKKSQRSPRESSEIEKNESISISIADIENQLEVIMGVRVNLEPNPSRCCIYRVPGPLRRVKRKAYTPKVMSIGPLHYGDGCYGLGKHKIRYRSDFGNRYGITTEKWQQLVDFINGKEQQIRDSYEEISEPDKLKFITMILCDAVFIIELFLKYYNEESDYLLNRLCLRETISSDLRLLENQLPFFVLDELYKLALLTNPKPENAYPPFISLSCVFFRHCKRGHEIDVKAEKILHFTDLSRYFMTRRFQEKEPEKCPEKHPEQEESFKDLPCAAKLQASGVKFNRIEGVYLLDIRFEKKKWLGIPSLKVAELQIPQINVNDYTESLMRNVMALEQCHYQREAFVCDYVDLMDKLIDTYEDVNLLVEAGIISNYLGEATRTADMFNGLCLEIQLLESSYTGIIKNLIDHYDNPWNHAKATLKRVYFSNLWTGTATVAAFVLLVLTFIQTICSIKQV